MLKLKYFNYFKFWRKSPKIKIIWVNDRREKYVRVQRAMTRSIIIRKLIMFSFKQRLKMNISYKGSPDFSESLSIFDKFHVFCKIT